MFELVDSLMQWRASLLLEGRVDDLVREVLFPFALYVGGAWMIFASGDALAQYLAETLKSRPDRGIVRLTTRVVAMDMPRDGRFRVWVEHSDHTAAGLAADRYISLHYCRETARGIQTEMLHLYPLAGRLAAVPVIGVKAGCPA